VRFRAPLQSTICPTMTGRDGHEYLLMGFFDGLVGSRPGSRAHAREGDTVVFDRGRLRGVVTAVEALEGRMKVRVDLGTGNVGTQILGWPAPTPSCPREWELARSSARHLAPASSRVRGEQNGDSGGEVRNAGQHRSPDDTEHAGSIGPSHSRSDRSSARKRSRKQHNDTHEAEVVAIEHKCAKYRKKLSASESMDVDASAAAVDEPAGRRGREESLTARERKDYEEKLHYWESKLQKLNARAEKRAIAKRRERLRREREREQERERV
jgi:hypothetical protein